MYKSNTELIVIDAKATEPIPTNVVFWSHDKGTAKLAFELKKDPIPQSLAKGTIVPICLDFVGGRHIYHAVIEDALNGIVSIVLEDNILGYQGRVDGSIYIELPDQRSLDTAGRFSFDIKRSPIDEEVPELEDYYWQGFNEIMESYHQTIAGIKSEAKELLDSLKQDVSSAQEKVSELEQSISTANTNLNARIDEISKKIDENDVFTKAESSANVINQLSGADSARVKKDFLVNGIEGTGGRDDNGATVPFSQKDYEDLLSDDGVVRAETLIPGRGAEEVAVFNVIEILENRYPDLFQGFKTMAEKIVFYKTIVKSFATPFVARGGGVHPTTGSPSKYSNIYLKTSSGGWTGVSSGSTTNNTDSFREFSGDTWSTASANDLQADGTYEFRICSRNNQAKNGNAQSDGVTPAWVEVKKLKLVVELELNGREIILSTIAHYHRENLATQEEAEIGESDEKLMTPLATKQSIEKRSVLLAGDQDVDGKKNFLVMPTVGGKKFLTTDDLALQTPFWTGASFLSEAHTITLPKSIADCKTGIVLKFNPYNSSSGSSYTSQTSWWFIPKHHVTTSASGQNTFCPIFKQDGTFVGAKVVTVSPTKLTGADVNAVGVLYGYVLTGVYEV